jgi:hypothetical protein
MFPLQRKKDTGIVVRAAQNRYLKAEKSYLCEHLTSQQVQFIIIS